MLTIFFCIITIIMIRIITIKMIMIAFIIIIIIIIVGHSLLNRLICDQSWWYKTHHPFDFIDAVNRTSACADHNKSICNGLNSRETKINSSMVIFFYTTHTYIHIYTLRYIHKYTHKHRDIVLVLVSVLILVLVIVVIVDANKGNLISAPNKVTVHCLPSSSLQGYFYAAIVVFLCDLDRNRQKFNV